MVKTIFFIIAVLMVPGCIFWAPADGGFFVSGELKNDEGENVEGCSLLLKDSDSEKTYYKRTVSGRFKTSFTVAPSSKKYTLVIDCPGYEDVAAIVAYGNDVAAGAAYHFGIVVLEENAI